MNNGDFQDQRFPSANYGNADFDVRHRFVFSYVYDLPFGRGRRFAKDASGVVNQIIGNWQMAGVFSAATGNYYTATDINDVSGGDCGGTVGYYCSRPNLVGNPNAKPCVPGTLFNTCAFEDNTNLGTHGNAGRNIIEGPGYKTWDTALVEAISAHRTKTSGIPRGILQRAQPCELFVRTIWRDQRRAHSPGTGPEWLRISPGSARAATDSVCAEVLLLNPLSSRKIHYAVA